MNVEERETVELISRSKGGCFSIACGGATSTFIKNKKPCIFYSPIGCQLSGLSVDNRRRGTRYTDVDLCNMLLALEDAIQ